MTVVFSVKWMPPAGSSAGKSNELITTPFFSPFMPSNDTVFVVKLIPGTSMPSADTVRFSPAMSHSKLSFVSSVFVKSVSASTSAT